MNYVIFYSSLMCLFLKNLRDQSVSQQTEKKKREEVMDLVATYNFPEPEELWIKGEITKEITTD